MSAAAEAADLTERDRAGLRWLAGRVAGGLVAAGPDEETSAARLACDRCEQRWGRWLPAVPAEKGAATP